MKHIYRLFIAPLIFSSLLAACAPASTAEEEEISPVRGSLALFAFWEIPQHRDSADGSPH